MNNKQNYPPYRYVILFIFMLVSISMQIQWLTHAAVVRPAKVSYPAPESTSQGILLWIGQISGMVFVLGMSVRNNHFLSKFLIAFAILSFVTLVLSLLLRESKVIKAG
jgi:hypothetical protein